MNTTENNNIIAEFLGTEKIHIPSVTDSKGYSLEWAYKIDEKIITFEELKYHNNWNWLIKVVERIKKNSGKLPTIKGNLPNKKDWESNNFLATNIRDAYKDCLKFIELYNQKNQNLK
jgi:hypothetical protein